ncbi:MAG: T9SS type A sorting domain-containing protein [Candidatus Cloacimonetes bacterium]|nr:T9SS type A sorting domain-containing protein [Candidatus Cloacimonadota bacterium]
MKKTIITIIFLIILVAFLTATKIDKITSVTLSKMIETDNYFGSIIRYENRLFAGSLSKIVEYLILEDGSLEYIYDFKTGRNMSRSFIDEDRLYTFYYINQSNYMLIFDITASPMNHLHTIEIPVPSSYLLSPQIMGDIIYFSDMRSRTLRFNKRTIQFESPWVGFYSFFIHKSMFMIPYFGPNHEGRPDIYIRFYDYSLADSQNPFGIFVIDYFLGIYNLKMVNDMYMIDDILYIMGNGFMSILDISDIDNISTLLSYDHTDPYTSEPQYSYSLYYDQYLIANHSIGMQIFDISDSESPLLVFEKSFPINFIQFGSMYIQNDLLYVNEGANLGVYDLKNNFQRIYRYGTFSHDWVYNKDYTIGIENSRFSSELVIFSVLDENNGQIVMNHGFKPGEYTVNDFEIVDNQIFVLSGLNQSQTYFDVYDLDIFERVFRMQLPFSSAYMKIISDFIYFQESNYHRHHIYQYFDNDLSFIGVINGVISSITKYEPDDYFVVSTMNNTEIRDKRSPLNVLYTRPILQSNIGELYIIADNTLGVFHGTNGIQISFFRHDDEFYNFDNTYYKNNDSDISAIVFHNGFMGENGLYRSLSRLYQIDEGFPRQIWEFDEHAVVTGMFVFPEKNILIIRKWSGVYVYDIDYTVSEYDPTDITITRSELLGNYPNPFNPETNIRFSLLEAGEVVIDVYNIRGQRVRRLLDEYKDRGEHNVVWNGLDETGRELGSGVYFYRMNTNDFTQTRRMLLLK